MTEQTITIDTCDHGPVTLPEPAWCKRGWHDPHPDRGTGVDMRPRREDITHCGQSINVLVTAEGGRERLLELMLWQDPFPTPSCTQSDDVYVAAQLLDGNYAYDAAGLDALAVDLMEAAGKVRRVARRLADEQPGGGQ
jgi:hypothetical protein